MSPRLFTALCLALVLAACFTGLWVHPLHEPDEARYAEIAREMAASGDWVTPRLDGIRYFEKPPLYFHLAALCMRWLGPTEAAARLPSAVAALCAALVTLALGRRAFGPRTGALAALLLVSAPVAGSFARVAIVDEVLAACTTAALAGAYLAGPGGRGPDGEPRRGRGPALLFWGAAGLALLAKGPVGLALPGVGVAAYALLLRDGALVRALAWPGGPALALAIAAPWTIAMEHANPGWLKAFILEQNVSRLVDGGRFGRDVAWWFYLAVLPAVFLPWTLLWPRAGLRLLESARRLRGRPPAEEGPAKGARKAPAGPTEADRARVFFAAAALAPLALLSAAHSQLVYYLLPLFPPLALLAADAFAREAERAAPRVLPAEGGDSSRAPLPDGRAPEPGPRTPAPGAVSALSLGDAGSAVSAPLTSRSIRVGPIDPPRPLATAFHALAVVFALAAAAMAFAHLAPDMVRDGLSSFLKRDAAGAARVEMRFAAIAPLFGVCAAALAAAAVGASLTGICEARGLRERAPLPLAAVLALGLAAAPWVFERAAPVYSAKAVADAVGAAAGPEDEVLQYGHFYRSLLFYLRRPAWLWCASFNEFGRSTSPDEVETRDLAGKADRLEVAWRGERRWVAVCGDDRDLAEFRQIVGELRVKVLARVGPCAIVESRPRPAAPAPPAPPPTPEDRK